MPAGIYSGSKKAKYQNEKNRDRVKMLTGGQAKIAAKAPPPNKIDEKDFAVLRAEKAKGRGMGLQDESVKPGKVIKAKRGTGILAEKGTSKNFAGYTKVFEGPQSKGRVSTISGVKPKITKPRKTYKSMTEMREAKGFKPGESAKDFNKRQMLKREAAKAAKATRFGKILLPLVGAGVAAQQYLKGKMKKDKNKKTLKDYREQKKPGIPSEATKTKNRALNKLNKKMGGGMMQKPMGYTKGGVGRDHGGTTLKLKNKKFFMLGDSKKDQKKYYDMSRAGARDMNKTGQGKKFRDATTVDKETGQIKIKRDNKKMGGGMMRRYVEGGESSYTKGYAGRKIGQGVRESLKDKVSPMKKERLLAGLEASRKDRAAGRPSSSSRSKARRARPSAGLGALGAAQKQQGVKKSETINLMKNKIYKYKAKKDSGFTDKQVSMQKDIKEKAGHSQRPKKYKADKHGRFRGKVYDASPTVLSKAGMTGSKRTGMPSTSMMLTGSKGKTTLNYARPSGGTIETGFKGYDERTPGVGLKTGKSIKVKCKLGKNKPTKMY